MLNRKSILPIAAIALIAGTYTAPAFAQNRFMDEAKAAADRRAENKAVREAEHPDTTKPAAATASTATPTPAETAPAAQTAPAQQPANTPAQ
ncbi:MAG TPA: hypothetical protein VGM26_11640 [Rhizomicrobium sp.]